MDKNIKDIIDKYNLLKEKAIVLAISGGPDSVVLLDLFVRLLPKDKIIVAHANHGIRLEARWDESFVRGLAEDYGVTCVHERLHLDSTSEAAAREARYDFLNKVREENKAKYILTAHHANDQVETVLLSLTRGSGPLATWGMAELEGPILRPLLSITKDDILKYAKKRHLRYHLDRTNLDTRYARNRIRAKVIPQLLKLNPRFLETLARNAQLGQEMEEAWGKILVEKEKRTSIPYGLDLKKLGHEPTFIQKELVKRKLAESVSRKEGITQENVNKIYELLFLERGKKSEIGGVEIIKGNKYLAFGKKRIEKQTEMQRLNPNSPILYSGYLLKMTKDSGKATKNNILLPSALGYNLRVRTWRDGDRIKTKSGTKKLSDIFTDAKISAGERKKWPVITAGQKIVWVPKLAASFEAIGETKNKVIKIEVRNERKKK